MADAWFLHRGDVYLVTTEMRPHEGMEPLEPEEASLTLRELAATGRLSEARRVFVGRASGDVASYGVHDELTMQLWVFRNRRLRLVPAVVAPGEETIPPDGSDGDESEVEPEKHWVEVQLKDRNGEPLVNAQCRIERPDGVVVEAATDSQGSLRVTDIAELGQCKVSFPQLEEFVRKASQSAS